MAGNWSRSPVTPCTPSEHGSKAHIVAVNNRNGIRRCKTNTVSSCSYHILHNPGPLCPHGPHTLEDVHHSLHLQLLQLRVDHHEHATPTSTIPGQPEKMVVKSTSHWYAVCVGSMIILLSVYGPGLIIPHLHWEKSVGAALILL